ncbi:PQQ-dependent sugar dehydrogenase [uncultured Flavobacterium sp.]|uniref:PQQ-dependent sugar dehydrogenase n=1 Tax=uncultured Flavobacterium sp. TaxID=165435 RepID=UPI0030EBB416|tara:strand:- start:18197 stop:19573 length:1377 start_codon:yes stop_codon:yes gene_type:complete
MKKLLLLLVAFTSSLVFSQTIAIQPFATGFSGAVEITHAGDSRLFVVQQGGLIRVLNSNGTVNATPFLNLSSIIASGGERGLLGLVFHPNYASNGYFFVNYTNTSGDTVIARYSVNSTNPDVAVNSGTILMTISQPYSNHNGGSIKFGPDGYLYIGMGDGGSAGDPGNRAQNINENLGKMLRIDVNTTIAPYYTSPAGNPYVGIAGNDEIWAIGVRNPWKFSFNRLNGDLWIADVGQNNIEEINKVTNPLTAGLNFGWKCYEGNVAYNTSGCAPIGTMTMPVAQYTHSGGNCSITGGYVYTGTMYPNLLNKYFFADYCVNRIGYVDTTSNAVTYTPNFSGSNNFTSFGEDMNGELYVSNSSVIYKIVDTSTASTTSFENSGFSLYPNPAKNSITISSSEASFAKQIQVFDVSGKLLLSKEVLQNKTNTIDVTSLSNGVYIVNVTTIDGNNYSSKLVKE